MSHSSGDISAGRASLSAALAAATARLARAGVESPRVDAELLAAFVLGVPRTALLGVGRLPDESRGEYQRLVAARAARVPVQHLTGTAPFRRLELAVGPGVFVPRPETELLVEWGLARLRGRSTVVDLCSGSGAIALSVADEYQAATVSAVECDPAALAWLRRNVSTLDRRGQVTVVAGDAGQPDLLGDLDGRVDLVLCNPPYVPLGTPVPAEVAEHDPAIAVFSGSDGLDVIRGVLARAADLLAPGGWLGVEHADEHGEAVPRLLREAGRYQAVADHRDLAGRSRFATAQLRR